VSVETFSIQGASENNLKDLSLCIPHDAMTLIYGPSGSGKTTLAVTTIAERMISGINELGVRSGEFDGKVQGMRYCFLGDEFNDISSQEKEGSLFEVLGIKHFLTSLFEEKGEVKCGNCGVLNILSSGAADLSDLEGDFFLCLKIYKNEVSQELLSKLGVTRFFVDGELYSSEELSEVSNDVEFALILNWFRLPGELPSAGEYGEYFPDRPLVIIDSSGKEQRSLQKAGSCKECGTSLPDLDSIFLSGIFCEQCGGTGHSRAWRKEWLIDHEACSWFDSVRPFTLKPLRRRAESLRQLFKDLEIDESSPLAPAASEEFDRVVSPEELFSLLDSILLESKSETIGELLESFRTNKVCEHCQAGICCEQDSFIFEGKSIRQLLSRPLSELTDFIFENSVSTSVLPQVIGDLVAAGLGQTTFARKFSAYQPSELSQVRTILTLIGFTRGAIYILDEPLDLVPQERIVEMLKLFRRVVERGNTLIVVGHGGQLADCFDYAVELGPGGGASGGKIVSSRERAGRISELCEAPSDKAATGEQLFSISGCLPESGKDFRVEIEVGGINCLSAGFAQNGEFVRKVLCPGMKALALGEQVDDLFSQRFGLKKISDEDCFDKVVSVPVFARQKGKRTVYSVLGIRSEVGKLFALQPEAKALGVKASALTRNPSAYRQITWRGRSVEEVLSMSISEAERFFGFHPSIGKVLDGAERLGLGYLTLDQEIATLSHGEFQRIRLVDKIAGLGSPGAAEGRTLLIVEHVCQGLGPAEVELLIGYLRKLVEKGVTTVALENNSLFFEKADCYTGACL